MFDFSDVEIKTGSSRIQPGVSEVTVTGVTMNEDNNYLEITFVDNDGATHSERMYLTEGARPWSMMKIKHMGLLIVDEEKFNKITTPKQLNALFTGKKMRIKFKGVEREKDGNIYVNAEIGLPPFAESLEISAEDSKLKYNESKDIRKLNNNPSATAGEAIPSTPTANNEESDDDLPF